MPDEILLERARDFDQEALAEIYDRYVEKIHQYIFHRVGSRPVAEELTAGVFVRMLEAIERDRFEHVSVQAGLYRIAHNIVVDHFRRQPLEQSILRDEGLDVSSARPRTGLEATFAEARLRRALSRLTEKQQQVIVLRFGEGLAVLEVAKILGLNEGGVFALQYRACAELRQILGDTVRG